MRHNFSEAYRPFSHNPALWLGKSSWILEKWRDGGGDFGKIELISGLQLPFLIFIRKALLVLKRRIGKSSRWFLRRVAKTGPKQAKREKTGLQGSKRKLAKVGFFFTLLPQIEDQIGIYP